MKKPLDKKTEKTAFSEWLEVKFLEWQAVSKKRATLQEFADHIGYSRPLISLWLAGKRIPTDDGIERLAELFGFDIFDVLELPRPDPDLARLNKIWKYLPDNFRQKMLEQGEKFITDENEDKAIKAAKSAKNVI